MTAAEVPAETLKVGDLVELPTQFGPRVVQMTLIERRVNGIKLTALDGNGTQNCFGFRYGQAVTRISGSSAGSA